MHAYLAFLPEEVAESPGYRVLPGVEDLLLRLIEAGVLVGITSGAVEAATHIKTGPRLASTSTSPSAASARTRRIEAS